MLGGGMRITNFLRGLLAGMFCVGVTLPAGAITWHPDVAVETYSDFGQNCGRFSVKGLNELQKARAKAGVAITYTGGQADFVLPHGMISFESQGDNGAYAAIAPNAIATVQHNGVQNPTFTGRYVGMEHSIHYNGIEYRQSEKDVFLLTPATDYKITRLNKLVTDVEPAVMFPGVEGDTLNMQLIYRSGAGTMVRTTRVNGEVKHELAQKPYMYILGGIAAIETTGAHNWIGKPGKGDDDSCSGTSWVEWGQNYISPDKAPLPYSGHEGDSGSPVWWWSPERKRYEFVATMQGMNGNGVTYYTAAPDWTAKKLESFTRSVTLSGSTDKVEITPANIDTGRTVDDPKNKATAHPYEGKVLVNGKEAARYVGLKEGTDYWKSFLDLADKPDWFAYDPAKYTNPAVSIADLFLTENLRLTGSGKHSITVDAPVEMGIGYVELQGKASFTLKGKGELNCAGFIVGEGTTLTTMLTPQKDTVREIRKVGPGTLVVAGEGPNTVNLMLGGGTTRLQRRGGQAAEAVHVANGATLVLEGDNQVARNVTLGYGGGTLDLCGHAYSGGARKLTAQTQDATLCNSKGAVTYEVPVEALAGQGPYLLSFTDAPGGSLKVEFKPGSKPEPLYLACTHTKLTQPGSGWFISGVQMVLAGTNTVHGMGSKDGSSPDRLAREDDWHYADAATPVTVGDAGIFTLGGHARLTGKVTVEKGGTFIMAPPFEKAQEYIEGGAAPEDTATVADYAGLKGALRLESGARVTIQTPLKEGSYTYAGRVSSDKTAVTYVRSCGGRVCLSNKDSKYGVLVLEGNALTDSPVRAKKVEMVAGNYKGAKVAVCGGAKKGGSTKVDGTKLPVLYVTCMEGGTLQADELSIVVGNEVFKDGKLPASMEIRLGTKEKPVKLGKVGKVSVRIKSSTAPAKSCTATLVENKGQAVIRVQL